MDGKVILEEHFSTPENNAHWDAEGEEDRNGGDYARDVERRLGDPDACLREMDRSGVEFCLLSLTAPGVQSVVDPAEALALARSSNDYVASLVRAHPDRLGGFAAVPMQDPGAAAPELERGVKELGLKGALVNGYSNIGAGEAVQYLDEEAALPFWDRVAALNVPVYLHPREQLPSQQRALQGYPELGGSAWGFALETSTHAVRLMLSGLFDRYPSVQVILGHLGEGLPFMLPRLQHRLDEQRAGARGSKAMRRPSYYFANNFYITTSGHFHSQPLREAIAQLGSERVLFSTDYPYEQMDAGARWFDDIDLPPSIKHRVGRENANQLFGLGLKTLKQGELVGSAS